MKYINMLLALMIILTLTGCNEEKSRPGKSEKFLFLEKVYFYKGEKI